jgi:methanethiol S-methyltransferase
MTRGAYVAIGGIVYLIFLAVFLYLVGFTAALPELPRTVDHGPAASVPVAIIVDLALIALFGVQHSVMARPAFKARWTKAVPEPIERTVYVLLASLVFVVLFALWRPLPAVLWNVANPAARIVIWALFFAGWGLVLLSTFLINHFELFGLQQVWLHARGRAAAAPRFRTPMVYRAVRHPLYSGFFLAFWATPTMTAGHLLLAVGLSLYMLIAIGHEEHDLTGLFGDEYRQYRRTTGMLIPGVGRARG